jgi:hypothetical protein
MDSFSLESNHRFAGFGDGNTRLVKRVVPVAGLIVKYLHTARHILQ